MMHSLTWNAITLLVAYSVAMTVLFALLCVITLCVTLRPEEKKVFAFLGVIIYMVTLISAGLFIYEEDLCQEKHLCFISINLAILLLEGIGLVLAVCGVRFMRVLQTFLSVHLLISGTVGFFVYDRYEWTILGSTFIFSSIVLFLYLRKEKENKKENTEFLLNTGDDKYYTSIQFA